MTATIIDGKALAEELRANIAEELEVLRLSGVSPGLATVLVGEDFAAAAYERHLRRLAEALGYHYANEHLPDDVVTADVLAAIGRFNLDDRVTGILVLHPLPAHVPAEQVSEAVDPLKDIEATHSSNLGLLALGRPRFVPSTPASCFYLLDAYARSRGDDPATFLTGRTVVVIGRSNNVGKPAQWLAQQRHATVIGCHSRTRDLGSFTRQAEVLIVAAGVRALVTGDMVSDGVIAVDVGIHPVKDEATGKTRMTGDIEYDSVAARAEAITPVPGGVGPVTDVWLIGNALVAAARSAKVETRFGRQLAG